MTAQDRASDLPSTAAGAPQPPSPTHMHPREIAAHLLLPFVSAFVDAVCFLGLFKTLTAFITGATILLATEVVRPDGAHVTKALVLVTFVVASVVWLALIRRHRDWRHLRSMLLAGEAALLVLFMICGLALAPLVGGDSPQTMLLVVLAVLAMSLQNALSVRVVRAKASTTAITANATHLLTHLVDTTGSGGRRKRGDPAAHAESRRKLRNYGYVLSSFVVGAFAGAIGYGTLGFSALAAPALVLMVLAAYSIEREST